jgi:hypothetical protein
VLKGCQLAEGLVWSNSVVHGLRAEQLGGEAGDGGVSIGASVELLGMDAVAAGQLVPLGDFDLGRGGGI